MKYSLLFVPLLFIAGGAYAGSYASTHCDCHYNKNTQLWQTVGNKDCQFDCNTSCNKKVKVNGKTKLVAKKRCNVQITIPQGTFTRTYKRGHHND